MKDFRQNLPTMLSDVEFLELDLFTAHELGGQRSQSRMLRHKVSM